MTKSFLGLMLLYLLFHLFVSERSIPSMMQLSMQQSEMQEQLASLNIEKAQLMDRVTRLRPETLDPDMVDEYSIQMLGHGSGENIIIMN
jgi:cell division protein FtsB